MHEQVKRIGQRVRSELQVLCFIGAIGLSGCGSERVLSVRFEQDKVNDPPKVEQEIGRCRRSVNVIGRVRVERVGRSKAVRLIQDLPAESAPTTLRCVFLERPGEGRYLYTMRMFIPSGGAASISFQDADSDTDFFQVDFPKNGQLRAPGDLIIKGHFPHDEFFSVAVNLNIGQSSTVDVRLLGKAQGSFTAPVESHINPFARNFSAVLLATGNGDEGSSFVADDLLVVFTPRPRNRAKDNPEQVQ